MKAGDEAPGGAAAAAHARKKRNILRMLQCCTAINYADRVNISVAIVEMSAQFGWPMETQSYVLSVFFWGYVCSQIAGAVLARKFGGKRVLGLATLMWSFLTILTPEMARLGLRPLLVCRVLLGVAEGFCLPVCFHLVATWVPEPSERAGSITMLASGCFMGTVSAFLLSPFLQERYSWHASFYLFGSAGVLWYAVWMVVAEDAPSDRAARRLEASEVKTAPTVKHCGTSVSTEFVEQCKFIMVSLRTPACQVIFLCHFCAGIGNYVGLAWFPTYFHRQWGMNGKDLSITVLPYITQWFAVSMAGRIADRLARTMPLLKLRKLTNTIGLLGAGMIWLVVPAASTAHGVMFRLCCACAVTTLAYTGYETNKLDIVPASDAGLFQSVSNTLGNFAGVLAVPLTASIVGNTGSWDGVFYMVAVGYVFSSLIFLRFARADIVLRVGRGGNADPGKQLAPR